MKTKLNIAIIAALGALSVIAETAAAGASTTPL